VGDFGSAKEIANAFSTAVGTNGFMAPEIFKGERFSPAADIFSYGFIVWQLFHPHEKVLTALKRKLDMESFSDDLNTAIVVQRKMAEGNVRPDIDPSVPGAWPTLIQGCWAPNPSDRPGWDLIFSFLHQRTPIVKYRF
jgi:serine/threonine protein kinase